MILEEIIREQKLEIERLEKENIRLQLSYQECWEDRLKLNEELEELKNKYVYTPKTNFSEVIELRDENKRLEKNNWRSLEIAGNNMVKVQSLKAEKKELQDRIDKAIEYVKENTGSYYTDIEETNEEFEFTCEPNELLEILKGEDKE